MDIYKVSSKPNRDSLANIYTSQDLLNRVYDSMYNEHINDYKIKYNEEAVKDSISKNINKLIYQANDTFISLSDYIFIGIGTLVVFLILTFVFDKKHDDKNNNNINATNQKPL